MSIARKGKHFGPASDETKLKISIGNKDKKCKPHSDETKLKISIALKGLKRSNEAKLNMSLSNKSKPWSQARIDAQINKNKLNK